MTEEPELEGQDLDETGGESLEEEGKKGERRRPNFQDNAVHNLQRARKSISGPDAEMTPRAQVLVQSAVAWALLDLAEAVRSHDQSPEDEPSE
jgi:hypothetical protein